MRTPLALGAATVLAAAAFAIAGLDTVSAAPTAYLPPPETATLKAGPNVEVANTYCTACHSVDYITTQPPSMGAGFWQAEVTKMNKAYGAGIADDDAKKIVDYLNATYRKPAP